LVGILVVEATFDRIYRRLLDTAAVIMVGQGIKTFLVSVRRVVESYESVVIQGW
jgi:hypothetical protein